MRTLLLVAAVLLMLLLLITGAVWWWLHPAYQQTANVTYGERKGAPLQLDVFRPANPRGSGVILLVSGSWKSSRDDLPVWLIAPLLRHGQTVFAVRHMSQPEASVSEIFEDLSRGVRFVRHHAAEYGVDPKRLGVTGASSGGHMSLLLATRPSGANASANDPVDRESGELMCVACFFPVTDLLNLGKSTENAGDGGPPKNFRKAFGPRGETLAEWKVLGRELSPIYHITSGFPPTLIIHGDADTLVPLEQSEWFVERAKQAGRDVKLIVRKGKPHGWATIVLDIERFAAWFDQHL